MIARDEILPIEDFVQRRPRLEREVLAAKATRRVVVGELYTFLFENHLTAWWQIQEMCRVEGIRAEAAIAHEIETYSALLPGRSELSATLLVSEPDPDKRDILLRALQGLWRHVWLDIGDLAPVAARFDPDQYNTERVSSVQFIRFPLSPDARAAFSDLSIPAVLRIDHPAAPASSPLSGATRGALIDDLNLA